MFEQGLMIDVVVEDERTVGPAGQMKGRRTFAIGGARPRLVIAIGALTLVLGSAGSVGTSASAGTVPAGVVVAVVSAPGDPQHPWLEAATLAGRRRHRLTPPRRRGEDRADFDPAVSPDRRRVAFVRRQKTGDSLWVVRLDGSGPRVLLAESQLRALFGGDLELRSPVWSADDKKLMVVVDENGCKSDGLIAISLDGRHRNVLVRLPHSTRAFLTPGGWSPGGSKAAYITTYADDCITLHWGPSVLSVASANGGWHRRLGSDSDDYMENAAWSSDGRQIAVDANCGNYCNLYLAKADGSQYRPLTADFQTSDVNTGALLFGWWKDKILYTRGARSVFVIDPKTKARSRLVKLPCARPTARRCAPAVRLDALSPTAAVFDLGNGSRAFALEVVSLPEGSVRRLPRPRALRHPDRVSNFVVALAHHSSL
jgi:hypothetical protein